MPDVVLTVNTVERTFTEVSKSGYDTTFVDVTSGVNTLENRKMQTKHTVSDKGNKPNRHLLAVSMNYIDAVTGASKAVVVHAVVSAPKGVPAVVMTDCAEAVGQQLSDRALVGRMLLGLSQ